MPGYCVQGTVGHKILNGAKKIDFEDRKSVEVKLAVEVSFPWILLYFEWIQGYPIWVFFGTNLFLEVFVQLWPSIPWMWEHSLMGFVIDIFKIFLFIFYFSSLLTSFFSFLLKANSFLAFYIFEIRT